MEEYMNFHRGGVGGREEGLGLEIERLVHQMSRKYLLILNIDF